MDVMPSSCVSKLVSRSSVTDVCPNLCLTQEDADRCHIEGRKVSAVT